MIRKVTFSLFGLCFVLLQAMGQFINSDADNIRLDFVDGNVSIRYDLQLKKDMSDCTIDLIFIDEKFNCIRPVKIKGDIGAGITSGINKEVIWDYNADHILLQKRMRPILIQNASVYFETHGKGPQSAFFSMVFPGLGDHRVADPRNMIFKPILRSASSLGFIGAGIVALKKRVKIEAYREYEPGFESHPVFHPAVTEYWAFPYDAEAFIGVGASIWLTDILWVYAYGRINEKMIRSFKNNTLTFNLSPQSFYLGLSF